MVKKTHNWWVKNCKEQVLRVLGLAMVKWTLIGRYREGDHDTWLQAPW